MKRILLVLGCMQGALWAQEAGSGFELRATVSASGSYSRLLEGKPRQGEDFTGGFRSVLYPTWKLSTHWTVSGAIQAYSRPYFYEQFTTQGYGLKADILQAHVDYSRFWKNRSIVMRVGQLSSAFGSFLLRYDDAENPLINMPISYGYYYKPITTLGLMGAQVDATLGKFDARAQFVNSSPANRRSIFDHDQYGNWAGGVGYTIRQGLRVGVSAYRGPYLHRQYAYYFRGEAKPRDLPASGYGMDVQWGHGHWNIQGELQRFQLAYRLIPTFSEHMGYAEARRVLNPRLYLAARAAYLRASVVPGYEVYEVAAGYRPNRYQLMKFGYQVQQGGNYTPSSSSTFTIQLVTAFRAISIARD